MTNKDESPEQPAGEAKPTAGEEPESLLSGEDRAPADDEAGPAAPASDGAPAQSAEPASSVSTEPEEDLGREEDDSAEEAAEEAEDAGADPAPSQKDVERVRALFSRRAAADAGESEESFLFARWTRPIAPAFFGLSPDSVEVMSAGFRDAAELVGLDVAERDPELAANILLFVVEDWADLTKVPHLDRLTPDIAALSAHLSQANANQYRMFTYAPETGIRLCVAMLRYDEELAQLSAPSLALGQAVQTLLLWADDAFASESPVTVRRGGKALVKSRFARLLKAAYAPESPGFSEDAALAEQLAGRIKAARSEKGGSRRDAAEDGPAEARSESAVRGRRGGRRRPRGGAAAEPVDPLGGDPRAQEPEREPEDRADDRGFGAPAAEQEGDAARDPSGPETESDRQ